MKNKTKSMRFLDYILYPGPWIGLIVSTVFFVYEISVGTGIIYNFIKAILIGLSVQLITGILEYITSIYSSMSNFDKIRDFINKEVVSLQYGDVNKLNSQILIKLLTHEKALSDFLIQELHFTPTNTLTEDILRSFEDAKHAAFAKACCVINDRKFIEIENLADSGEMLVYFMNHKDKTDGNLIISRIFSYPFIRISNKIQFYAEEKYALILYLYLIANYYSRVNTYLYLYECETCTIGSLCENNDYVSLMVYSKEKGPMYQAFFAPANTEINSLLTLDNDLMLAQALEKDFQEKLKSPNVDLSTVYTNLRAGYLLVQPKNIDILHSHLGLKGDKSEIQKKLIQLTNSILDSETKKKYQLAIKSFFR